MSSLFDSLSEELFQVLKGSGKTLTLYGQDGNKTYEPKTARRVFATPDNIMISVVEAGSDSEVKLYLSQSTDVREISPLINTLRQITTRYNVLFNVRKFGRELQPKDFAYQASVMEASMWGSTRTSYQRFGPTKLIVRHCRPVAEGVIGARGRNILSMFVETKEGERFRFAETHLSAGRAFAQHINQGGKPHDEIGTNLAILAQESLSLARVNRYIHHSRNVLGEQAVALRTPIKNRIVELRRAFLGMSRPRGYHKIKESLPLTTANLNEASGDRLGQLQALLMIDSNHALAESLMPVALLKMGEHMTNPHAMFRGRVVIDNRVSEALAEALVNEYGIEGDTWSQIGSNFFFNESEGLEAALEFASLTESEAQLFENDAITDYATQWTQHRFAQSDARGFDDNKDRAKHEAGIGELATGLREILSGQMRMPDYPEHVPGFADAGAKARFYLDLYVAQHALANAPTLNYVSTIIDKMAEGKKLDGAEKTIAGKLIDALENDVNGGEVDESYYSPNPADEDNAAYERQLETLVDQFDPAEFLQDVYPSVMAGDDKDEALDINYVMTNLDAHFAHWMDYEGFTVSKGNFKSEAETVFPQVEELCQQHGYHFDNVVREFAQMEDKPQHHGIAAGDNVATDMGPATVISIEGDIASVEFLHGGAKEMHVDDMDLLPKLGGVAEEAELSEWFNGFDPSSILEAGFEAGIPPVKKAAPTNPNFDGAITKGDRVTHKAYGSGEVVADNGKMVRVKFDKPHVRLPDDSTVTMAPGVLTKAGAYRAEDVAEDEQLDELSQEKVGKYFSQAATDRSRAERKADAGDEKAALRLKKRDAGLGNAFKKMRESDDEDEVLGGDKGENLINDVKEDMSSDSAVQRSDEAYRTALENILKNANFRK